MTSVSKNIYYVATVWSRLRRNIIKEKKQKYSFYILNTIWTENTLTKTIIFFYLLI